VVVTREVSTTGAPNNGPVVDADRRSRPSSRSCSTTHPQPRLRERIRKPPHRTVLVLLTVHTVAVAAAAAAAAAAPATCDLRPCDLRLAPPPPLGTRRPQSFLSRIPQPNTPSLRVVP
jgi:hypothetical protein